MTKIFAAAKRASEEEVKPLEFFLPGTEDDDLNPEWVEWDKAPEGERGEEPEPKHILGPLHIYPPSTEQMVLIVAAGSDLSDSSEQAATLINVFYEMLDDESRSTVRRLLLDRNTPVSLDVVMEIITWAMEEAADRPTVPQSVSSSSRKNAGRASTARARRKA